MKNEIMKNKTYIATYLHKLRFLAALAGSMRLLNNGRKALFTLHSSLFISLALFTLHSSLFTSCRDDLGLSDETAIDANGGVYFNLSIADYLHVGESSSSTRATDVFLSDGNYASWTLKDTVYDTSSSDTSTNPSKPTSITYTYTSSDGTTSQEFSYSDSCLTWDETYVYSVDILLFRQVTGTNSSDEPDTIYYLRYLQQNASASSLDLSSSYTVSFTGGTTSVLTSDDIYDTDRIYIIANHSFTSSATSYNYIANDQTITLKAADSDLSYSDVSNSSSSDDSDSSSSSSPTLLSALSALTTNTLTTDYPRGPLGKYLAKQYRYPFEMCTYISGADYSLSYDEYGVTQKKYYDVVLERAMAKLLIHVKYKEFDDETGSAESNFTELCTTYAYNNLHGIKFRVNNYADKASLIPDGDYYPRVWHYGSADTDISYCNTTLADEGTTSYGGEGDDDDSNHKAADFIYTYTTTSTASSTDEDGNTTTTTTIAIDSTAAVFYFYPNNWVDSTALKSTYGLTEDEPIFADRQTYVSMIVEHSQSDNRTTTYKYHIPVNYLLPTENDIAYYGSNNFDELLPYYRIDRNTLYEVWVYITEQDAGLRVALSTGRGTNSSIAQLTDDADGSITIEPVDVYTTSSDGSLIEDLTDADDDMGDNSTVGTVISEE